VGREIPVAHSACGKVFRGEGPTRVTELGSCSALPGRGLGPALLLPLRTSTGSMSGVLVTARGKGEPGFDAGQLPLAAAFAEQAALALQLARDQRSSHEKRMLSARDRFARELQDSVVRRLFTHGLELQSAQLRVRTPEVRRDLAELAENVQDIISDIRVAVFDLHDVESGTALRKRLHDALAEVTGDSGLRTTIRIAGPVDRVPRELADHAEAVVREALTNTVRHARATAVTVTVTVEHDLTIDVTDDGRGLDVTIARAGLRDLAQRAEQAGGEFGVDGADGGGTWLHWHAPLPDQASGT
jgi:two-component system, NarL family, sensor histidine kinase DevS